MMCSNVLNSRVLPAVSLMSGGSTFRHGKKNKTELNGANLILRRALRAGGVMRR